MKRRIAKVCMIILVLCTLGFVILYENREQLWSKHPQLFFVVEGKSGKQVIEPWYSETEDVYYLFLPSYAEPEKVKTTAYSEKWFVAKKRENSGIQEKKQENNQDKNKNSGEQHFSERDSLGKDIPFHERISCKRQYSANTYQMIILQSANLPTMYMETSSGSLENLKASKEVTESGAACLYDVQGNLIHQDALKSIRGRGNTSFNGYDKKPWNITFDEPCDLFDMGSDEKYVLMSNASDPTLVRNDYMRRLEQALQIKYVSVGQFLDLYVNGEYQGNYYLCSPVMIGENRVAITDLEKNSEKYYDYRMLESAEVYESVQDLPVENQKQDSYEGPHPELYNKWIRKGLQLPSVDQAAEQGKLDITGGYLLERDYEQRYLTEYDDDTSSFTTIEGECFRVKSPECCSEAQIEYIASFMENAETLLFADSADSGTMNGQSSVSYLDYIDIDCFAKRYLAEEISKNYDGGVSSTYYYKDADSTDQRLHMAPGWDYDMCLGNYVWWMEDLAESPEGLTKLSKHSTPCLWFEALYEKPEYYEKVVSYFQEYAEPFLFEETPALISRYQSTLSKSVSMNHIRWSRDLKENVYYENIDKSYAEFGEFVEKRAVFLKKEWSR